MGGDDFIFLKNLLFFFQEEVIFFGISFSSFFKEHVLWGLVFSALLGGCATRGDVESIQLDTSSSARDALQLQRNIYDLNAEIKKLSSKIDAQAKKQNDLQQQISALSAETRSHFNHYGKNLESSSKPMLQNQAGMGARLDKLQVELQNLTGRFEESKYFAEKTFRETRSLRESYQAKLQNLETRMAVLNKALEDFETKQTRQPAKAVIKSEAESEEQDSISTKPRSEARRAPPPAPAKKVSENPKAASSPEEAFKNAFDLFGKGDIEGAKTGFQRILQVHGKTKYAENAHYWLGECYFKEKKFEEAILEYEDVVKKKGNKAPDAMFRQGMAFLEMKDTVNAKLILKEVVKRFPKSTQAALATKKLKGI